MLNQEKSLKPTWFVRISVGLVSLFLAVSLISLGTAYASSTSPAVAAPVFSAAFNLSNDKGMAIFPMDANSGSHVYVVWTEGNRGIFFRASPDNGTTWSPPLSSAPLKLNVGTLGTQYPVISANGSNVYVTWTNGISGSQPQLFFTASTNYGITFSTPIQITTGINGSITPVISSWGNVVYVAYDQNANSYVIGSSDGGVHWTSPFHVSTFHEPQVYAEANSGIVVSDAGGLAVTQNDGVTWKSFHIKGCCGAEPWVWGYGSNVYVTWETKGSTSQSFVIYSHNNGLSWSSEINLAPSLSDVWGPKIAAWGNNVYVTVTVHPGSPAAQNYIIESSNAGVTWSSPISESGTAAVNTGTSLNVIAYGNYVFAIWGREVSSGHWYTMATDSTNAGTTWVAPPGINISNNPTGSAATSNDVSTGWVVNFGSDAFACWQYQPTTTTNSQIYFASSS